MPAGLASMQNTGVHLRHADRRSDNDTLHRHASRTTTAWRSRQGHADPDHGVPGSGRRSPCRVSRSTPVEIDRRRDPVAIPAASPTRRRYRHRINPLCSVTINVDAWAAGPRDRPAGSADPRRRLSSSRPRVELGARIVAVVAVCGIAASALVAGTPGVASAAGLELFDQSFQNNTADGDGGVALPAGPGGSTNMACLSASGNPGPAALRSCTTSLDTPGSGKLRLTDARPTGSAARSARRACRSPRASTSCSTPTSTAETRRTGSRSSCRPRTPQRRRCLRSSDNPAARSATRPTAALSGLVVRLSRLRVRRLRELQLPVVPGLRLHEPCPT